MYLDIYKHWNNRVYTSLLFYNANIYINWSNSFYTWSLSFINIINIKFWRIRSPIVIEIIWFSIKSSKLKLKLRCIYNKYLILWEKNEARWSNRRDIKIKITKWNLRHWYIFYFIWLKWKLGIKKYILIK